MDVKSVSYSTPVRPPRTDLSSVSQGQIRTAPVGPVTIDFFDPVTQASIKRFEEQLRLDPDGDGNWARREFSDSAINDAIGKADMTTMDDDQIEAQIEVFSFVMQSGREQDFSMLGKNGDQTTTSMSQYLSWLAQRRAEMRDDGTYSPAIASTW